MPMEANTRLRPTSRRERRIVALVLPALLAATIAVVVVALAGGHDRRAGCVSVTAPNAMGGALLRQCGRNARQWCSEEARRPDALARQVEAACGRAGY